MTRRRAMQMTALLAAAVIGSVATIAIWGGKSTASQSAPRPAATAQIERTDLTTTVLTAGALGYEPTNPVVNLIAGTYTAIPSPGTTIQPGQALYRVDNQPIVLMTGATPAWRGFAPGMADGPDVVELEANLIALGYAHGLFLTASAHFSALTAQAISRWQAANGYGSTGEISPGQVVFETSPVLVGAPSVAPGQAASSGDQPYQVTTTTRTVSVPLTASLPSVNVGEPVSIVLPSGSTTPGRVSAVGPASPQNSGSGSSSGQGSSAGASNSSASTTQSSAAMVATVVPDDPEATGTASGIAVQVSVTAQSAVNVLAVPISALLALSGGGYGLEVVGNSGHHVLVAVTTGIFTSTQVQVSGSQIEAGMKVVVAQ